MHENEAVFVGDFICWLREDHKIEYSLNGDIYAAADVEEDVVCKEVTEEQEIQMHYLTNGKVKNKKGEYINVHETIMPLSFE